MANKKSDQKPEEIIQEATEEQRGRVLEGAHPAAVIEERVPSNRNEELSLADNFINSEKTTQAERASFANRASVHNHTLGGIPADVHQALVSAGNLKREEAVAYREVQAVLAKYESEAGALPEEVLSHLRSVLRRVEQDAAVHENNRTLLEKYA